jgi:hypothetical protein
MRTVVRPFSHMNKNSAQALIMESSMSAFRVLATASNRYLLLAALVWSLSACSGVKLISDYDEPTDKALTALQQSTDDFLAKLIKEAPSEANAFEKHKAFYDDLDQQLRRLEFRVASIPKNSRTQTLVSNSRSTILGEGKCTAEGGSLRDLHCIPSAAARGPSRTALEIARRNVNQTIGAALALELAKRQGLEQNR